MTDLNKVLFTGILTHDLELYCTSEGIKIVNLRIAIHRKYKTKSNEIKLETNFVTVVVWKTLAEICAKYLKKGSKVLVEGRLKTREYVDKNQQKRNNLEIQAENIQFLNPLNIQRNKDEI
jgi:single-strand DNA-binding protein